MNKYDFIFAYGLNFIDKLSRKYRSEDDRE